MAYKEGSQTSNLLFGLGGRVIGGVLGYLAGDAQTGWQVGGSLGDSLSKPVTMNQQSFVTKGADPNSAYTENKLDNRMFGFTENKNQMSDWSKYVTSGLDAAVNISSISGLTDKLGKKDGPSIMQQWFGTNKTKNQSESDKIIASTIANKNMISGTTPLKQGNTTNDIISTGSSLYSPVRNNISSIPQYTMPDLSSYSLASQARYMNNRYNKFGQFDHLIQ